MAGSPSTRFLLSQSIDFYAELLAEDDVISQNVPTHHSVKNLSEETTAAVYKGLPRCVRDIYERCGIIEPYAWQAECLLMEDVLQGRNLVYGLPTSAGAVPERNLTPCRKELRRGHNSSQGRRNSSPQSSIGPSVRQPHAGEVFQVGNDCCGCSDPHRSHPPPCLISDSKGLSWN
jgi:hypothetical protein